MAKKARTTKKATKKAPAKKSEPNRGGRPSKFKAEYVEQAYIACARMGATDIDLAKLFAVDEKTINTWKHKHPEFLQSLKVGKDEFDTGMVEAALRERATGYSHPEDKIFNDGGEPLIVPTTKHYPPDTTAGIFWLKNRQPDRWRDKLDHEHTGKDGKDLVPEMSPEEAGRRLAFVLASAMKAKPQSDPENGDKSDES